MRFHARVGVLPHERELPQPLEVDLTVGLMPAPATDVAPAIVDYRELYERVAALIAREPLLYLEEIADRIASDALRLPGVSRARVAVRKPHVPLPGPLAYAEIVVEDLWLSTPEAAAKTVRFIDGYRSYVINYNLGRDLVADWVEGHGDTPAARWAAFRAILSTPRLPGDLAPPR